MARQIREEPKILAAAERQMLFCTTALDVEGRLERHRSVTRSRPDDVRYVAISREAGAGGGEIGHAVGTRLGWPVYDKNLLDKMAEQYHVMRAMLDLVDETSSNWVYDVLGTWMDHKIVPHDRYVAYLSRLLLEMSKKGSAIFIGRAAQFVLPRPRVFAVRIIAAEKYRIQQIMARTGVSAVAAQRAIAAIDEGRREFVERFFHHDLADPHCYDLVINVEHVGPEGAVSEILSALTPTPVALAR